MTFKKMEIKIGYVYYAKPPRLTMPASFEKEISKKDKLFLLHKKALETSVFRTVFRILTTFSSYPAFAPFFNSFLIDFSSQLLLSNNFSGSVSDANTCPGTETGNPKFNGGCDDSKI